MSFSPLQITRIVCAKKIHILAHTNAYSRKYDPFSTNFSLLYYESVNSPFLLWKFYLDVFKFYLMYSTCLVETLYLFFCLILTLTVEGILYVLLKTAAVLKQQKLRQHFANIWYFLLREYVKFSCQFFDPVSIDDTFQNYE